MLHHLEALKQTSSVTEYQLHFEELSHGIILYNPAFDDTYLVTRFLGGLKEEIRAAIALHRHKDVDTASALALLQEEELENSKNKIIHHDQSKYAYKAFSPVDRPKTVDSEKSKIKPVEDKLGSL